MSLGATFDSGALVALGRYLHDAKYAFTPVTPVTHARVLARIDQSRDLRDIFGWNATFEPDRFPREARMLDEANALETCLASTGATLVRSRIRFARSAKQIYAHSSFPTNDRDSVFFGPDTSRFLLSLRSLPPPYGRLVDVGTGSGVAGLCLSAHARDTLLTDTSPKALVLTRVNMDLNRAGAHVHAVQSDLLEDVHGDFDTIICNPPFLLDSELRTYRNGGGELGTGLSVELARQALDRLAPGGRFLMYTGAPIRAGQDPLRLALERLDRRKVVSWRYEEMDPDIFSEQLDEPGYEQVERIAAVVLSIRIARARHHQQDSSAG